MIPEAAVEAAAEWLPHSDDCTVRPERDCTCWQPRVDLMRAALEAAAPHMLSHEREETRLAHLDAVVNARTVDKLNAAIGAVLAVAAQMDEAVALDSGWSGTKSHQANRIRAAITEALGS